MCKAGVAEERPINLLIYTNVHHRLVCTIIDCKGKNSGMYIEFLRPVAIENREAEIKLASLLFTESKTA